MFIDCKQSVTNTRESVFYNKRKALAGAPVSVSEGARQVVSKHKSACERQSRCPKKACLTSRLGETEVSPHKADAAAQIF